MVDLHAIVRAYLLTDATLVGLIGSRLYAGRDVPPVGYKPDDGACITFKVRGGGPDYDDALLNPSVQLKCYAESEAEAWALYRALYDHLHNAHTASILHAESDALGQLLEEPDTKWIFVLTFFTVMVKQS